MIKPLSPSQTGAFFMAQSEVWPDERKWCEIFVTGKTNLSWHKGSQSYNQFEQVHY